MVLTGNEIGFSVASSQPIDGAISRIPYDVSLNPQDNFNSTSNEFTAPKAGLYLFSFSIGADAKYVNTLIRIPKILINFWEQFFI